MVRTAKPPSDNERLAEILRRLASEYGYEVYQTGWARTTYDVNRRDERSRDIDLMVRVESFATTSGEIHLHDEAGRAFAEALGAAIEEAFPGIGEAVIVEHLGG